MKISQKPTDHILIKAKSNNPDHYCAFAILFISDDWRKTMLKRLNNIRPFHNDPTLQSHRYIDGTVSYYMAAAANTYFNTEAFLSDTPYEDWAFVELTNEEIAAFEGIDTRHTTDMLMLYPDGTACFESMASKAVYYSTARFRVMQLISKIVLLK